MNELKIFNNPSFGEVRVVMENDEPRFCLADVCKVLELTPSKVAQRLESTVLSKYPADTGFGVKEVNFINEDGLYDVILDSRKPEAKVFRKWVTSEVLPSIRKDGGYMIAGADESEEELMARALVVAQNAIKRKQERIKELESQHQEDAEQIHELTNAVAEMAEKVSYVERILQSKSTATVTQIAQDYGMSAKKFNKILAEHRIQRKVGGQWVLYSNYLSEGYVHSRPTEIEKHDGTTKVVYNTEWTTKGRLFLYEELKRKGILPLIEQ